MKYRILFLLATLLPISCATPPNELDYFPAGRYSTEEMNVMLKGRQGQVLFFEGGGRRIMIEEINPQGIVYTKPNRQSAKPDTVSANAIHSLIITKPDLENNVPRGCAVGLVAGFLVGMIVAEKSETPENCDVFCPDPDAIAMTVIPALGCLAGGTVAGLAELIENDGYVFIRLPNGNWHLQEN